MNVMPDDAVDHARVDLIHDPHAPDDTDDFAHPMVAFPDREWHTVPGLVPDRIEVSGVFEHVTVPDPGEREPLGEVAWGDDDLPRRLECDNGVVVTFDNDVPTVETPDE